MNTKINTYIKNTRRSLGLTQIQFAKKTGIGLRFLRELEQGKMSLKMDKVDRVLRLLGKKITYGDLK